MTVAKDIALYLLQIDKVNMLFRDFEKITLNGRTFVAGNARLNKYLHLAQNIFYAKTGSLLFEDKMYAYDNGGVVRTVQENFGKLVADSDKTSVSLPNDKTIFLNKLYRILKDAPLDALIKYSHEDPAWKDKHMYYNLADQVMDTYGNIEDYKERYEDILEIMERMPA